VTITADTDLTLLETASNPTVDESQPTVSPRRWLWPEALVVVGSLILNLWSLSVNGWGNAYYAAAVRSMTESWRNFFFASFDPGGFITVDKPPFAFWVEAISARIFGFSSWSILAPAAIAGALAVALIVVTVRSVWGRTAGIVAGAALATMPVSVAVARSNMPDAYLVLSVVAAMWAIERATRTDRMRWLVAAGAFVGIGFLSKLGAVLMVVPALWLAYLLAASASWRRRVVGLAVGSATIVVIAGMWILAVQLTPAGSRPFVGGSSDGTALDLTFGYNGLGRITGADDGGGIGGGGLGGGGLGPGGPPAMGGQVDAFGGAPGIGRLFNAGMGDQVMWLAPLACGAIVAGAVLAGRRRLDRRRLGSLAGFAAWAIGTWLVFSFASGIFHNYYVSLLAPAVAALVGTGAGLVVSHGRWVRAGAAVAVAGSGGLALILLRRVDALTWLRTAVPMAVGLAVIMLVVIAWRGMRREVVLGAVGVAVVAVLAAPTAWSVSSVGQSANGTFPDARPDSGTVSFDPLSAGGGPGGGGFGSGGFGGSGLNDEMLEWLRTQRTTETWIVAVGSAIEASSAIIDGDSVMAMGGFSGSDPAMSATRLAELVRDGDLRFVLAGGGMGGFDMGGTGASAVSSVVQQACEPVRATAWGGAADDVSSLFDCAGRADAIETTEPTATTSGPPDTSSPSGSSPDDLPTGNELPEQVPGGIPGVDMEELSDCAAERGVTLPEPSTDGAPPELDAQSMEVLTECLALVGTGTADS
jgi:4-amino-4-deoxy-L-arabinose transferase-like glycosyltransferase